MSMGYLSHDDHVSQSHFSFSPGLVLRSWGCVLVFSCLSLGYLLCRRVTFVTCRDRESCWLFLCFQKFLFWLENTMYCLGSWSNDPRGPGRRREYKRRQHAPLPALPMPGAGCCAQYHTTVSPNLDTVCEGGFSWRLFWQTLERSRSAGPSMLVR